MYIHALLLFMGCLVCEEMASGVLGYKIKTNPMNKIGFVVLWIMERLVLLKLRFVAGENRRVVPPTGLQVP